MKKTADGKSKIWPALDLRVERLAKPVYGLRSMMKSKGHISFDDFREVWPATPQDAGEILRKLCDARRAELDRILVGLGWGYAEGETVYAAFEPRREVGCDVKGVPLVGFEGSFVSNLVLPDGLAVGRAVSLGHGWFRRAFD